MLGRPSVAVLPADRRASAIRRFPPGCGRRRNATATTTRLPHRDPLPITSATAAAAAKPPLPPNPSIARAADKPAPPRPRRAIPAAASSGTEGPGRTVGSGRKAAAAANVRRPVSAVRRYPPGCGRSVAVRKPSAPVGKGEAGAGEPTVVVGKPKARAYDREEMLRACGLDEFDSDDEVMDEGCGGDAGAQEEGGGEPWAVTGVMAVPFMPWTHHGRRSQLR